MLEEPNEKEHDETLKIILLGEPFTGKTSLINVYVRDKFDEEEKPTESPSYLSKVVTVDDLNILINMWDTAGQEKYRSINKIFIKNSNIILFIYDITRKKTFNELSFWVEYVGEVIENDEPILGVVGNKIDLFDQEKEFKESGKEFDLVKTEEGKEYAKQIDAEFLETSAKENAPGFDEFMNKLVEKYIKKYMKEKNKNKLPKINKVNLDDNKSIPQPKKKCC